MGGGAGGWAGMSVAGMWPEQLQALGKGPSNHLYIKYA